MIMDFNSVILAFSLSLVAGLSTAVGGVIALFAKNTNTNFLSLSLGFSAGVMIYVSMIEIFVEAKTFFNTGLGEKVGELITIIIFFGGMLLIGLINKLISNDTHIKGTKINQNSKVRLMRTGTFTAIVIAIHNFPEGLASFVSSLQSPAFAIPIVLAIALHNIPEGISVSVPIYYATGSKRKAFLYSLFSGMTEPLGAIVGYLILLPFMSVFVYGVLYAIVAGIMVFISFDELLPAAREYGDNLSIYGLMAGMSFMALSLWLFI
jgi:ZIP family zinc transporter